MKIVKGNPIEQALLKFILNHFKDEYNKLRDSHIEVLHWKSFNSHRKKSTIVMRNKVKRKNETDGKIVYEVDKDDTVYIYSKGAPEAIRELCNQIFIDEHGKTKKLGVEA